MGAGSKGPGVTRQVQPVRAPTGASKEPYRTLARCQPHLAGSEAAAATALRRRAAMGEEPSRAVLAAADSRTA